MATKLIPHIAATQRSRISDRPSFSTVIFFNVHGRHCQSFCGKYARDNVFR